MDIFYCKFRVEDLLKNMAQRYTVGENIIATTKIQNNYGAIQSLIFSNIAIAMLDFIDPCKVITLNPLCIIFSISTLLIFFGFLSKVIAFPTIAIAIVVALSRS